MAKEIKKPGPVATKSVKKQSVALAETPKQRRKDQLNFFIGERLYERALSYERASGHKVAAQCRIGLDMLLKANNF